MLHHHQTLKQPCVTRWNSVLAMIDSVLICGQKWQKLLNEMVTETIAWQIKDKEILLQLRELLLPFHNLTKLVSNGQPTLGLIPLIIKEVREIIKAHNSDNDVIKDLKDKLAPLAKP